MPQIATTLTTRDHWGTVGARTGFTRANYKITPGLYCTGSPDPVSPVLVTANYKLSFDALRRELSAISAWILVIDTRGINVWCAAGKGTFSAGEIAYQVQKARLGELVTHRALILPQLSANGVAAHELKKLCGFSGRFGPVKAAAIPDFLRHGECDESMRTITFTLAERAELIPLEICMLWKPLLLLLPASFLLSGFSPAGFGLHPATARAGHFLLATITGILAGAVVTPLLLPWLAVPQFWRKGMICGLVLGLAMMVAGHAPRPFPDNLALLLWTCALSSYMAMNYTGSTPFTSLSGVATEMRGGLAVQILFSTTALATWLLAPFIM